MKKNKAVFLAFLAVYSSVVSSQSITIREAPPPKILSEGDRANLYWSAKAIGLLSICPSTYKIAAIPAMHVKKSVANSADKDFLQKNLDVFMGSVQYNLGRYNKKAKEKASVRCERLTAELSKDFPSVDGYVQRAKNDRYLGTRAYRYFGTGKELEVFVKKASKTVDPEGLFSQISN